MNPKGNGYVVDDESHKYVVPCVVSANCSVCHDEMVLGPYLLIWRSDGSRSHWDGACRECTAQILVASIKGIEGS